MRNLRTEIPASTRLRSSRKGSGNRGRPAEGAPKAFPRRRVDGALVALLAVVVLIVLGAGPAMASGALVLVPDAVILPILLVVFVLLIFPLNAMLFQPIFRALDARAERIAGARERSEQLQRDADQVLERYETAIREARAKSEVSRQAMLETAREEQLGLTAAARSEAEGEVETARDELNRSIEEARTSLRASAEGLATAAAERVLGRVLS